jgi:hypothetical protein
MLSSDIDSPSNKCIFDALLLTQISAELLVWFSPLSDCSMCKACDRCQVEEFRAIRMLSSQWYQSLEHLKSILQPTEYLISGLGGRQNLNHPVRRQKDQTSKEKQIEKAESPS